MKSIKIKSKILSGYQATHVALLNLLSCLWGGCSSCYLCQLAYKHYCSSYCVKVGVRAVKWNCLLYRLKTCLCLVCTSVNIRDFCGESSGNLKVRVNVVLAVAFFLLCNLPSEGQNWISYSVGEVQMQMLGFNITLSLV